MQNIPGKILYSFLAVGEFFVFVPHFFAEISTSLWDWSTEIKFLYIDRTLTLKWKSHSVKGHRIPGCWRLFIAGQEFPLGLKGTVRPQSTPGFSGVVERAPAKEDAACWEMDECGLGQKKTRLQNRKMSLHCINRPVQTSEAVVHSYFIIMIKSLFPLFCWRIFT